MEDRKGKRRTFSAEYNAETVRSIQRLGKSIGQVALEVGIGESPLRRWVARAEIEAGRRPAGALRRSEREELVEQRRENQRMERESLKKRRPSSPKRASVIRFIATERAHYPVALLCRLLQVSRRGFYAAQQRPAAPCTLQDETLRLEIAAILAESRGRYGSPRVHAELAGACSADRAQAGGAADARCRLAGAGAFLLGTA